MAEVVLPSMPPGIFFQEVILPTLFTCGKAVKASADRKRMKMIFVFTGNAA